MQQTPPTDTNSRAFAVLRIGVGVFFLIFGEYKVFGTQFTLHGGFQFWINRFLEGGAYPFMAPVLRGFVLSHATPIAFLVAYSELAVGIALVFGILVRPASIGGIVFFHEIPDLLSWLGIAAILLSCLLALVPPSPFSVSPASRVLSSSRLRS